MADEARQSSRASVSHSHGGCDVVAKVDELLARAMEVRASDVHFEPTSGGLVVKYRLDGALQAVESLPAELAENVISRLKVLGGLLTYRTDIPQEGRIERAGAAGGVFQQRLAVFPTVHGQRAVVRLFYEDSGLNELDELGLPESICTDLKRMVAANQGVVLLTGPAGSGKSTTLAAMMRYILARYPGKSIVALEDPVERHVPGVTQVEISPHGAMTFPVALRSLLRQDPEVLMVGEIRDAETARIAVEAALTGHLLLTTMHSGTPAGALIRLLEMGVEPYQVTSAVAGVLNQRLLRRLCERCKTPDGRGGFAPAGCEHCFRTGYRGRVLIAELVEMDPDLRAAVLAKADRERIEAILMARAHRGIFDSGMALVAAGATTRRELNRICGYVGDEETPCRSSNTKG